MSSTTVGRVKEVWRYPVKSMGGEKLPQAFLGPKGIPGDRSWAVIDTARNEIRSAKKWPNLMDLNASLDTNDILKDWVVGEDVPDVTIHCPDGTRFHGRDANSAERLSTILERSASLAALAPEADKEHYRLARKRTAESVAKELGVLPDESETFVAESMADVLELLGEYATPPGTYFDSFPLHLLTTNSLEYLSSRGGFSASQLQFRPNLLIDGMTTSDGMIENDWLDKKLKIGPVVMEVICKTVRCSMPKRGQAWADLQEQPLMTRALVDHCDRHIGINALVLEPGTIEPGDLVELLD